jgi:hypothetical protein
MVTVTSDLSGVDDLAWVGVWLGDYITLGIPTQGFSRDLSQP